MPRIPLKLPEPPPQVFLLATPAHFLAKLHWEIDNLRRHMRGSKRGELFSHLHASYMTFNVAVTAWHLCDWTWHSWPEEDQRRIMTRLAPAGQVNVGSFRGAMSGSCRELKICQQIANSSKHMRNDNADETVRAGMKWEIVRIGTAASGSREPLGSYDYHLVVWDGGNQRDALEVFEAAFAFWRRRLSEWGFIEDSILLPEDDETDIGC